MSAPVLFYDNFPTQSAIVRELHDNELLLTIPTGDPSDSMLHTALMQSALAAGFWSAIFIALVILMMSDLKSQLSKPFPWDVGAGFLLFCGSFYSLLWYGSYQHRRDALQKAWSQSATITLAHDLVVVDTGEGPMRIEPAQVKDIRLVQPPFFSEGALPRLELDRIDHEKPLELLPGHEPAELTWLATALRRALGVQQ